MTLQFLETVEFFPARKGAVLKSSIIEFCNWYFLLCDLYMHSIVQALVVHISHQSRRRDQNKITSAGINLKVSVLSCDYFLFNSLNGFQLLVSD